MTAPDQPQRRPRRTWPQRLLIVVGILLAALCFGAARIFWDARTVLADLPRIRVGSDVLAQAGSPGEPLNFLLVGVDSSEGLDPDDPVRSGRDLVAEANGRFLSDTILLLRVDPATGDASVLSIPRDFYVDVPGSSQWKINSTLLIGGMDKLIETIDANLGIPVNHFVMVDFAGFARLVELVDGVPVYFPYPTRDLGSGLSIPDSGCWILDGSRSLAYVRGRTIEEQIAGEWVALSGPAPDLARIDRQQEFMVLALERALAAGGNDLTRIREFVEAGTQAVQLDERLTPGDLLELASAFSDYDTDALMVDTLPVASLFSEDGRYLGEALQVADAVDLLAVFQGRSDSVRPEEVTLAVVGTAAASVDRATEQLLERGFEVPVDEVVSTDEGGPTVLRFDPGARPRAEIVARYLEGVPRFEAVPGTPLTLRIGPDFAGVRPFPRPRSDIDLFLENAVSLAAQALDEPPSTTSTAPDSSGDQALDSAASTTSTAPDSSGDQGQGTADRTTTTAPSSGSDSGVDVSDDLATGENGLGTIDRGRPPDGIRCIPIGD